MPWSPACEKTSVWVTCRRYKDIAEKLGGEDEAANSMGKLISSVASRLAGEGSIGEVRTSFQWAFFYCLH